MWPAFRNGRFWGSKSNPAVDLVQRRFAADVLSTAGRRGPTCSAVASAVRCLGPRPLASVSFDPAPDGFWLYAVAVISVNLDQKVSGSKGALMAQLSTNGNNATSGVAGIGNFVPATVSWVGI